MSKKTEESPLFDFRDLLPASLPTNPKVVQTPVRSNMSISRGVHDYVSVPLVEGPFGPGKGRAVRDEPARQSVYDWVAALYAAQQATRCRRIRVTVDDLAVLLFVIGVLLCFLVCLYLLEPVQDLHAPPIPILTLLRSRIALVVASLLTTTMAIHRSMLLAVHSIMSYDNTTEQVTRGRSRRFTGVMAVYALNVIALGTLYTLAAAIDPSSISHTDATAHVYEVFLDSIYDMTLVASGTGYGERIPQTWLPKLIAFTCSAYLTIYLSMTVFARILSSSAMYWKNRAMQDYDRLGVSSV